MKKFRKKKPDKYVILSIFNTTKEVDMFVSGTTDSGTLWSMTLDTIGIFSKKKAKEILARRCNKTSIYVEKIVSLSEAKQKLGISPDMPVNKIIGGEWPE